MGLGLWDNMPQSDKPLNVAEHVVQSICAADHNVAIGEVKILGWFDVPEDSPDRQFGDTIYVQAVDTEYPYRGPARYFGAARALYGITDHGELHIWAD